MTGYHPNFEFLKKLKIDLCSNEMMIPQYDPQTFESNERNIFLAGVVCCGMDTSKLFIENSRDHALKIFEAIRKR